MSFINWGGESPEQRAIRARLEQEALFEQAVRMANARNSAQFGGAGSGGPGNAGPAPVVYYLRAIDSDNDGENPPGNTEPWDRTSNLDEMNAVFGENGWSLDFFETVNVSQVFSPTATYVFIDGSQHGADELSAFLDDNRSAIEDWVFNGGRLFLNSAPNEGGNIDFGFGGVTLVVETFSEDATIADSEPAQSHPIFSGPGSCGTDWTGDDFAHATLTGEFLSLIVNPGSDALCAELSWGAGTVLFGSMTITNWHDPDPEATYLRQNIHAYLGGVSYSPQLGLRRSLTFRQGSSSRN